MTPEEKKTRRKEYMKEYHKKWYEANREEVLARVREYRTENPELIAERKKNYGAKNRDAIAAKKAQKYLEQREYVRAKHTEYYKANSELIKQRVAEYRRDNPEVMMVWRGQNRVRMAEGYAAWCKANRGRINSYQGRRKAEKLQATPLWADEFIIDEVYALSRLRTQVTGVAWHVDHKVPLKSNLVCGLHCEFNLPVMLGRDNIVKGNRKWDDMP